MAELNEFDKEIIVIHCKPVSELKRVLAAIKPTKFTEVVKLNDCKDFEYQDKYVYFYNNQYYYK